MHVVFVCSEFPLNGRPTGGFGTYVDNLSLALTKENIEVTIICQGDSVSNAYDKKRRIVVVVSPSYSLWKSLRKSQIPVLRRIIQFFDYPLGFSISARLALAHLYSQKQVHIVEGGDFGAELFFILLFPLPIIKYVIKLHTPSFVIRVFNREKKNLFYFVLELMEQFCLKKADAICSPTQALARLVSDTYHTRVKEIIPYPIPSMPTGSRVNRDSNLVLYVGKIQYKKGVSDLMRVIPHILARNTQTKFILIGPDTINNGISTRKMLIQKLNLGKNKVTFMDPLPQQKLRAYYKKAGILVVPSHWENFPNVILEAGLNGIPIVATETGGISEMIRSGETGILVSPNSPARLTNAVVSLLRNAEQGKRLAKKFERYLKQTYSQQRVSQLTLAFYGRLLK